MTPRLIPLADRPGWEAALAELPHGPAHTHWYNRALAASVEGEIVLFEYADGAGHAVCPLMPRRWETTVDVTTPFGFAGFTAGGDTTRVPAAWWRTALEQGWICGYLALHPVFRHPFVDADGLQRGRTLYVLDLTAGEPALLESMHQGHRVEIRRYEPSLASIVTETQAIAAALPALYAETLARVGAGPAYRLSDSTLHAWLASPGCVALGVGRPPQAVVLCLYTRDIADYVINASTADGRRYTRLLLWAAIRELKRRGVRQFNLGGGAREGDGLEAFKRRFGACPRGVPVLKQVFRREEFGALCRRERVTERGDYFPPYRAPAPGAAR